MRVIDLTEYRDEEGEISLENRIRGTLAHGLHWYGSMQDQEAITQRLDRNLGNEHTLLRNVPIPGTNLILPMLLLSPQGVRVLVPSRARGIFRAKGESWQSFDSRGRRFKNTRPNLQEGALGMANTLLNYLQRQGYPLPDVEAVLLFTNPRTHVDTAQPSTRIVHSDAFDHFAANLQEKDVIMDQEDIRILVDTLHKPLEAAEAEREPEQVRPPKAEAPEPKPPAIGEEDFYPVETLKPMETRGDLVPERRIRGLTVRQLLILGIMAFLEVIILVAFALVIFADIFYS